MSTKKEIGKSQTTNRQTTNRQTTIRQTTKPQMTKPRAEKPYATKGRLTRAVAFGGAVLGMVAGVNALLAIRAGKPRDELGGVFARYPWRFGDLAYSVTGRGAPLVLVHGLGAGNSMAEWREVFPLLSEHFTVYAFDFSGWGLSDQPQISHQAADYVSQLVNFIEDVVGAPCVVAASADGCNYAIEAATRLPNLVTKLVLTNPTLVLERGNLAEALTKISEKLIASPILGATLNNILASSRSIRFFARHQLFYDKSLADDNFVRRHASCAHRSASRLAIAGFLSGRARLDARPFWNVLEQPALLIWGRNSTICGLETAPEWLAAKPDAQLEIIEKAMLLPHCEHPQIWTDRVLDWLRSEAEKPAPSL